MATSRNITYTFSNQTAYDLWTDGVLYEWKGDSSGKFSYSPVRVKAYSVAKAFGSLRGLGLGNRNHGQSEVLGGSGRRKWQQPGRRSRECRVFDSLRPQLLQ